MTANQMADELELILDRSSTFGSPGYEDFELSSVLNMAEVTYIKKFYDELNNRKGKGFQEIEIRNQGLGALIKDAPSLTQSASQVGVITNANVAGTLFDLPSDHMYTIYEECVIDKTECGTKEAPIYAYVVGGRVAWGVGVGDSGEAAGIGEAGGASVTAASVAGAGTVSVTAGTAGSVEFPPQAESNIPIKVMIVMIRFAFMATSIC